MHHIYKTKGIILADFNRGESHKLYHILTRDFGVVFVYAQGVRAMKSKLNFALQVAGVSDLDMVHGKEMWRLTGAQFCEEFLHIEDKEKAETIMNIFTLIRRLTPGEERNEKLFDIVFDTLCFLKKEKSFQGGELLSIELICCLRILDVLGYCTSQINLKPFLQGVLNKEMCARFAVHRKDAVREVNSILENSHL